MKKLNNKKGISLIVLVITIIVMIVLASAIILSLSSSGIIGRANKAKADTNIANAKQVVALAKGEWQLDEAKIKNSDSNIQNFADYAASKLEEAGYKVGVDKDVTVSEEGAVNTVYVGEDGKRAIIPDGFTVSTVSTEDSVTEGLVVKDQYGNEFVWVPVDGENVKVEIDSSYGNSLNIGEEPSILGLDLNEMNGITEAEYIQEYYDMKDSVDTYGGFYVGRYETGGFNTARVVSKAGEDKTSCVISSWHVMYNMQKALHSNSSSVVSGMIYGGQWDAIMDWMSDVPNITDSSKLYIYNSMDMGYYCMNDVKDIITDEYAPTITGSNPNYSVKNIYDLAGNHQELTQEARDSSIRVARGGSWGHTNVKNPVSMRGVGSIYDSSSGSRLQLYIK